MYVDILAGSLLGMCVCVLCYLHHYYPPWHHLSYLPYSAHSRELQMGQKECSSPSAGAGGGGFHGSHSMLTLPSQNLSSRTS